MDLAKVYIIVLNWNGWQDTIECLESVVQNTYGNYRVVVCDNYSSDGSLDKIKQWAHGKMSAHVSECQSIAQNMNPSILKPLSYIEYNRQQAELGGELNQNEPLLILIQTGDNLGFAGGNNIGIRYALARGSFDYVWLLNNDTVIDKDALSHLVDHMQQSPKAGICGSTLLYYNNPDMIQALGGAKYNKWLAKTSAFGAFEAYRCYDINIDYIEQHLDYVAGASMLVSREFLIDIGLMNEQYFLYFEEPDWAVRSRSKYKMLYASKSIVYHKEGGTTGSNHTKSKMTLLADYYTVKNKIVFTKKHYPEAIISLYIALLVNILKRVIRGEFDRIGMILSLMALRGSKIEYYNRSDKN